MTLRDPASDALVAIWRRWAAISSTPWLRQGSQREDIHASTGGHIATITLWTDAYEEANANADFIAHAPADIEYLLLDNKRLRAEVEALRIERDAYREELGLPPDVDMSDDALANLPVFNPTILDKPVPPSAGGSDHE